MAKIEKLHLMLLIDTMNQWWIDSSLISDSLFRIRSCTFSTFKIILFQWCIDFNVSSFEMINAIFPTECKTVSKCSNNCFYHGDVIHWNFNLGNSLFMCLQKQQFNIQSVQRTIQSNFVMHAFGLTNVSTNKSYVCSSDNMYKCSQIKCN